MFQRIDSRFDVLAQMLRAVHLGGRLSARLRVAAPWGLRFGRVERLAGFHALLQGSCWVMLDGGEQPVRLNAGDVVLLPHGTAHVMCDAPESPAVDLHTLVGQIAPGEVVDIPCGAAEPASLLCGSYSLSTEGGSPLLRGLPELIHVRADPSDRNLSLTVQLLAAEAQAEASGCAVAVERLVDLLFVYALRAWLRQTGTNAAQCWFAALNDKVIGPVMNAIHAEPARRWTVDEMAALSGLSRAPFNRRFREAVGEPPLSYVTRWRISLAADLLERGERIARVAGEVGYDNEFAFAKAFKRVRGAPPGQYRKRHGEA